MKKFPLLMTAALFIVLSSCGNKEKNGDNDDRDTVVVAPRDNSSVTIEGDKGDVKVESNEGTDLDIDVSKDGGSIKVEDGDNKVDIKIKDKDDDKKE